MKTTDFHIAPEGSSVRCIDADGAGHFIAMMEDGNIIAEDRQTAVKRIRHRSPLEFRQPIIRRLDQDRFLVANARTGGRLNGRIFDFDGKELDAFYLGDSIADILIFSDKIAIMYYEEGMTGGKPPEASGLGVFSLDGEQIWGFHDLVDEGRLPESVVLYDCEPICKFGHDVLCFVHYNLSRLVKLNINDFSLDFEEIPEQARFAGALSVCDENEIVFYTSSSETPSSPGEYKNCFLWWDRNGKSFETLPAEDNGCFSGLEKGRFLQRSKTGYSIVSPLED